MAIRSTRDGFRAEHLATYLISKLAFITRSDVQNDYGIDMYCGLIREAVLPAKDDPKKNVDHLLFDKSFFFQVKSRRTILTNKQDGTTKRNTFTPIVISKEELTTFRNLGVPYFIGNLCIESNELRIYQTSVLSAILNIYSDSQIERVTLSSPTDIQISKAKGVGGVTLGQISKQFEMKKPHHFKFKLGTPIITLDMDSVNDPDVFEKQRSILGRWIDLEKSNLRADSINVPMSKYYPQWKTNDDNYGIPTFLYPNLDEFRNLKCTVADVINKLDFELAVLAAMGQTRIKDSKEKAEFLDAIKALVKYRDKGRPKLDHWGLDLEQ